MDYSNIKMVLVCGSTKWTDKTLIANVLSELSEDVMVIHGAAIGADSIAGEIAEELDLDVKEYPARWEMFGKAAGPLRNQHMINLGPDIVFAFHNNIKKSRGTIDTIKRAIAAGIPHVLFGG